MVFDSTMALGSLESMMPFAAMGALIGAVLIAFIFVMLLLYVYHALVWMTIARKLKYKYPWLAWIPFANIAMILQLGGFSWGLVFLLLVPILGWLAVAVLYIISTWRIFEKRKYPGWLSLAPICKIIPVLGWLVCVAYLIILGFVAWSDKK